MSTPSVTSQGSHVESATGRRFIPPVRASFSLDGSRDEDDRARPVASAPDEKMEQNYLNRILFDWKTTGIRTGFNTYDYQQKYPDDPHGAEASPDARVWKTYMDESEMYDKERVEGWKDTIDVLLVFAGLFSGVLTGFVLQVSGKMRPDYAQISALLLQEIVAIQRAGPGGGQSSSGLPIVQFRPSHSRTDAWVNGLWFTSLSLSLMCAVLAMLAKQWLHHFTSIVSGTSQDWVRVRHYRFTNIETWHVPALIDSLPAVMNVAVVLFLVGLVVFLAHLNIPVAVTAGTVSMATFSAYFASIILPLKYIHCPYKSPMTTYVHFLYVKGVRPLLNRLHCFFDPRMRFCYYIYRAPSSLQERERMEVQDKAYHYDVQALEWLYRTSSNSTVKNIILQSICGFNSYYHPYVIDIGRDVLAYDVKMAVLSCLKDNIVIPSMESKLERLLRTFRQVERHASLSMLSRRNIDFSEVTDPQLRALFEVFDATESENLPDPQRRLNLILDYISGPKNNVYQHPSLWKQLLNINLPNTPDQLHFAVMTEILSQLNATSIFKGHSFSPPQPPSIPSSASIPDIIHCRPDQGVLYLARIFEIPSWLLYDSITRYGELLKSMMKWALITPTSPGFKPLLREITTSLKQLSSSESTCLVVPVLLESVHFMDIEIAEWSIRETMIELLRDAGVYSESTHYHEYSMSFYTNLLRLIMDNNKPQVHSISKHIPFIFNHFPRFDEGNCQNLFDAIQKKDGLNLLGRLETSGDLLEFFDNYVTHMIRRLVSEEFWMDYVHRPKNLFLICRYTIIAGRDDLLLSFAQINSAAQGWNQCMQELIQLVRNQELFNSLVESRFQYQNNLGPPRQQRKVLDVVSDLKATLELSSPEYDIPEDITEPEQDIQRITVDIERSSSQIQRNSTGTGDWVYYPRSRSLSPISHDEIPMDYFRSQTRRWWNFGKTLRKFLNFNSRHRDQPPAHNDEEGDRVIYVPTLPMPHPPPPARGQPPYPADLRAPPPAQVGYRDVYGHYHPLPPLPRPQGYGSPTTLPSEDHYYSPTTAPPPQPQQYDFAGAPPPPLREYVQQTLTRTPSHPL